MLRAHFSGGGTGVSIADGVVSIPQSVATNATPTFTSVTANLTGDLLEQLVTSLTTCTDDITDRHYKPLLYRRQGLEQQFQSLIRVVTVH